MEERISMQTCNRSQFGQRYMRPGHRSPNWLVSFYVMGKASKSSYSIHKSESQSQVKIATWKDLRITTHSVCIPGGQSMKGPPHEGETGARGQQM